VPGTYFAQELKQDKIRESSNTAPKPSIPTAKPPDFGPGDSHRRRGYAGWNFIPTARPCEHRPRSMKAMKIFMPRWPNQRFRGSPAISLFQPKQATSEAALQKILCRRG